MAHNPANDKFINDGKNTAVNQANASIDVDPQVCSSDAAAVTALGVGFLYLDAQGNVRKSGDGDAVLSPRSIDQGNIILNGQGQYGDNTFFPDFSVDPTLSYNSRSAFIASGGTMWRINSQRIPTVSFPAQKVSLYARSVIGDVANTFYCGCAFYDGDSNLIDGEHHGYWSGSITTLAADLNLGDTTISLVDGSSWSAQGISYQNKPVICEYTEVIGKQHGSTGYSRAIGVEIDSVVGNTVTLVSPWVAVPGFSGTIPAGTAIRQAKGLSTYKYIISANQSLRTDGGQSLFSGMIGGVDFSGESKVHMFPPGAIEFSLAFLTGLGGTVTQIFNSITQTPVDTKLDDVTGEMYVETISSGIVTQRKLSDDSALLTQKIDV